MKIILLLLLLSFLHSSNIQYKYIFETDIIYSSDLYDKEHNPFELISIPKHTSQHKVKALYIIKLFKKHNINITNTNKVRYITFQRKSGFNIDEIYDILFEKFSITHNNIIIDDLKISIIGSQNIDNMILDDIIISSTNLHKNNGNFSATFTNGNNIKTVFFKFKIKALVYRYKLTKNISKGEKIDNTNSKRFLLDIQKAKRYISYIPPLSISKKSMNVNHLLSSFDIKQEYMIKKNSLVEIGLIMEGIEIISYFRALESGYKNEIIKLQNENSGKIRYAKIIAKNKAILE